MTGQAFHPSQGRTVDLSVRWADLSDDVKAVILKQTSKARPKPWSSKLLSVLRAATRGAK